MLRLNSSFKLKIMITFLGAFMNLQNANAGVVPKLGYVPQSFPRDIIKINQFAEHVLLAQILEPLVDADRFGNMTRGIAERWNVSQDGKTIIFFIEKGQVFSNGNPIRAKDVKYSINRHIAENTQSSNFLKSIKEVKETAPYEVTMILSEANVAILKALSRDHLGIVPDGWTFDSKSIEPYIGSGPYRLMKSEGKWYFVRNDRHSKSAHVTIPKWELVYFADDATLSVGKEIPDYVPMASQPIFEELTKLSQEKKSPIQSKEQTSFVQTSLWWHPTGKHYGSAETKSRMMAFLDELVDIKTKNLKFQRATGIVPVGISGYLPERVKFEKPEIQKSTKKETLSVAVVGAFDFVFEGEEVKKLAESYGLEVNVINIKPIDIGTISSKKPDVVMAAWAGGFNDPEGFLPLLNQLLGVDFVEYLGDLRPIYLQARVEQDWSKRSDLFRSFNKKIVEQKRMVPGWKVPMYAVSRSGLTEENIGFRYTPRLINVKYTK